MLDRYFMTNLLWPSSSFMYPELPREKKFISSYKPNDILPLMAPNDLGAFAAAAFAEPAKFSGKTVPIFGDLKTVDESVKSLARSSGEPIEAIYRTDEETDAIAKTNPIAQSQKYGGVLADGLDLDEVKSWGIPLTTLEEFLKNEQDLVKKTFDPATQGIKFF